eukprot:1157908-Pelagomonas_calceolata.AAC.1
MHLLCCILRNIQEEDTHEAKQNAQGMAHRAAEHPGSFAKEVCPLGMGTCNSYSSSASILDHLTAKAFLSQGEQCVLQEMQSYHVLNDAHFQTAGKTVEELKQAGVFVGQFAKGLLTGPERK